MQAERLKILTQLLAEEPNDPFHRYALAMEHLGKDVEEAQRHLNILLVEHPNYLPTYYQAATLYADQENAAKASDIFEKGIALAQQHQELKTLKELESVYAIYRDEWEL